MLELISKSFLLGATLSSFIGPVFFMLIQATIKGGAKQGFLVLLGLYISDSLYILLTYFFYELLIELNINESYLKILGGAIFILIGVGYLLKKNTNSKSKIFNIENHLVVKSFIINSLNPSVFFFWFAALSLGDKYFDGNEVLLYLLLGLVFSFIFDLFKIYFALKLNRFFKSNNQLLLNKIIGIILLFIGIQLFFSIL